MKPKTILNLFSSLKTFLFIVALSLALNCSGGSGSGGNGSIDNPWGSLSTAAISSDIVADYNLNATITQSTCTDWFDVGDDVDYSLSVTSSDCELAYSWGDPIDDIECRASGNTVAIYGSSTTDYESDCTISGEAYYEVDLENGNGSGEFNLRFEMSSACGSGYTSCSASGTIGADVIVGEITTVPLSSTTIPSITSFTVDEDSITAGESATLHWTISDPDALIDEVQIDSGYHTTGAIDSTTFSTTVSPSATQTYTLSIYTDGEVIDSETVTVTVTEEEPSYTCDDGTVVADSSECPSADPDETVTCDDGTVVDDISECSGSEEEPEAEPEIEATVDLTYISAVATDPTKFTAGIDIITESTANLSLELTLQPKSGTFDSRSFSSALISPWSCEIAKGSSDPCKVSDTQTVTSATIKKTFTFETAPTRGSYSARLRLKYIDRAGETHQLDVSETKSLSIR